MARTAKTLIKIRNAGSPVPGFFDTIDLGTGLSGTDLGFGVIEFDASGGGTGVTFETPVGAVDSSNTSFTVGHIPAYIVIDGASYFENNGYSRSGLTITTIVPPTGFIRSAY